MLGSLILINSTKDLFQESLHEPPPYWLDLQAQDQGKDWVTLFFLWSFSEMSVKFNKTIASKKLNLHLQYPE